MKICKYENMKITQQIKKEGKMQKSEFLVFRLRLLLLPRISEESLKIKHHCLTKKCPNNNS